jgi:hypothetical protein
MMSVIFKRFVGPKLLKNCFEHRVWREVVMSRNNNKFAYIYIVVWQIWTEIFSLDTLVHLWTLYIYIYIYIGFSCFGVGRTVDRHNLCWDKRKTDMNFVGTNKRQAPPVRNMKQNLVLSPSHKKSVLVRPTILLFFLIIKNMSYCFDFLRYG